MIELKRLKLINWHNFENVTFDCARLTYMIGVNAVGKTTILDAIRYCLTTNRNFNALGNKKSGRTLQGSVHAKQRGENAFRRPGRTVAYIGAEFWDSVKRTNFVIAVRVESEGPMQELHPGDQTWYISEDGCTLEQLPFIDPRTGAPSSKENFKPAVGRLSYTRSPGEARDRICRALGIGRAASPLGKKFNEVFQMGTSMDEIPNFREFLYQYILPQPELDLEALQGDRVELENLHAVLAEAQTRAAALEQIVDYGREAAQKDGMGTGRPAAVDGNLAAELTARLLKAGFTAELAARLVNVALALKSEDESGATLDLISVDLYTGTARLFKAGAAPGFLVHGGRVRAVGDTSLPVGILGGVNGQSRVVHLTVGDYAVLVSDGLLVDGPGWVAKQLELSAAAGEAPEKVAKTLVETARVRAQKTGRPDDITAAVLRLEKCV